MQICVIQGDVIATKYTFHTVESLAALWRKTITLKTVGKRIFSLPQQDSATSVFKAKYDRTQRQLRCIAAIDDLLSGMKLATSRFSY